MVKSTISARNGSKKVSFGKKYNKSIGGSKIGGKQTQLKKL